MSQDRQQYRRTRHPQHCRGTTQLAFCRIEDPRRTRRHDLFGHRNVQIKQHQPPSLYRRRHRQNRRRLACLMLGCTHAVAMKTRRAIPFGKSRLSSGLQPSLTGCLRRRRDQGPLNYAARSMRRSSSISKACRCAVMAFPSAAATSNPLVDA